MIIILCLPQLLDAPYSIDPYLCGLLGDRPLGRLVAIAFWGG
ncbi:MAG: hypothetical protein AB4426_34180 [Xenococcaceae cyanobacterium]